MISEIAQAIISDLGLQGVKIDITVCLLYGALGVCERRRKKYQIRIDQSVIYDRKRLIFVMAHELRHVWQSENDFEFDLVNAFHSRSVEYTNAREEADANEYARRCMEVM